MQNSASLVTLSISTPRHSAPIHSKTHPEPSATSNTTLLQQAAQLLQIVRAQKSRALESPHLFNRLMTGVCKSPKTQQMHLPDIKIPLTLADPLTALLRMIIAQQSTPTASTSQAIISQRASQPLLKAMKLKMKEEHSFPQKGTNCTHNCEQRIEQLQKQIEEFKTKLREKQKIVSKMQVKEQQVKRISQQLAIMTRKQNLQRIWTDYEQVLLSNEGKLPFNVNGRQVRQSCPYPDEQVAQQSIVKKARKAQRPSSTQNRPKRKVKDIRSEVCKTECQC